MCPPKGETSRSSDRPGSGGARYLGRFFAHGDLRLVILNMLTDKPRHGYEIIKAIEEAVGGVYSPSPGTIYPMLTLLEELGYVTVTQQPDGTKKLHTLTGQGLSFLDANRPVLEGLLAKMADATRTHGDTTPPQVIRAMENLKLSLKMRQDRGPLTAEEAAAVAAILDAAATALDRT